MWANVLQGPRRMAMQSFDLPVVGPEDLTLDVEMVGVCGGDVIEYQGRNFKAHYPMILGHETVGRVREAGEEAQRVYGVHSGDRVVVEPYILCRSCRYCLTGNYQFCVRSRVYGVNISCEVPPHLWGAYGETLYVAPGSRVHGIDAHVDARAACLTSVLGNAVRWVRTLGQATLGDRVLILGSGAQALASLIVVREIGVGSVTLVAHESARMAIVLARRLGANVVLAESADRSAHSEEFSLAIECTGETDMLNWAMEWLGVHGRLVLVGTRGGDSSAAYLDRAVFKELTLRGGLGQSWDTETAVDLINHGRYPVEDIITAVRPVGEAQSVLEELSRHAGDVIHYALVP